jgi:hypothetical protein
MLKFYITAEERKQAHTMAGELDVHRSDPPGQPPYVWTNGIGMGCIEFWYGGPSPDGKVGTIYFHSVREQTGRMVPMVECATEITHRPPVPVGKAPRVRVTDLKEHEQLVECFYRDLLGRAPDVSDVAALQDVTTLKRRVEELDALNQVATILGSAHDLPQVLELALGRIRAALRAEAGSLLLKDEATGELVFAVTLGPVADQVRGQRLAPGEGIAGWVAESGESVLVPVASADPRFSDALDRRVGFVTRSILSVPLKTSRGNIGVVQLLNHIDGRSFSRSDLQLLETIALHAAAIIERATLLDREREWTALLALSNVAEAFSAPLESLECYLVELFGAAAHENPDMVPTIQKAMERLATIRELTQHFTRTLPDHHPQMPSANR